MKGNYTMKQSLIRMQVLLDTARNLNSKQDTNLILKILLAKCLEYIPGGDIGAIFLYNEETNKLDMRAWDGMNDIVKTVSLNLGESMTGITFNAKKPIFFCTNEIVLEAMSTMNNSNLQKAINGRANPININSSICCPLMFSGKILGVLVIDNINKTTSLKLDDVSFLEDISVQAAIALNNAQSLEKEKQNNSMLKDYTEIIEKEKNNFQYALETHKKFTAMVLEGSTIGDIISEASQMISCDIFIVDSLFCINENTLNNPELIKQFQDLINNLISQISSINTGISEIVLYDYSFKVLPIIVNQDVLGWLFILLDECELETLDEITIERTTTIIALEILKATNLFNIEQSLKGDFIDNLLKNPDAPYTEALCSRYKISKNGEFKTLYFEFYFSDMMDHSAYKQDQYIIKAMNRFYQILTSSLKKVIDYSLSMIKGSTIVTIINHDNQDSNTLDKVFDIFASEYDFYSKHLPFKVDYKVTVSQKFNSLNDFKLSYDHVLSLINMMKKYGKKDKVIYYDDKSIKHFLAQSSEFELNAYMNRLLGPLLLYKGQSKKEFLNTLEIYLKSNCNWTYTKKQLFIHGNTLSYRINRISNILNLDLNNYQDRLNLQIAFEIREMFL